MGLQDPDPGKKLIDPAELRNVVALINFPVKGGRSKSVDRYGTGGHVSPIFGPPGTLSRVSPTSWRVKSSQVAFIPLVAIK